jgi:DNA-binding transcriptional LysR family regulator
METSDITLIRTIFEQGSLTQAAERLHISQPTLSKKLARLEMQLQTKLFHRSPTGVIATEVTQYIIESSEPIQGLIKRIDRHVEQLTQHETGTMRLGVGPIIEQVLLPEVLIRFVEVTGNVRLSIITDQADALLSGLANADLDVIAGPFHPDEQANLVGYPLIQDQLVTVARAGHPIFTTQPPADIESFPFASPAPQGTVLGRVSRRGRKLIVSENFPLLKNLTLNSDCLCAGPWHVFHDELESGALREVKQQPLTWTSACLVRPESAEMPLVKLLVNLMVEVSKTYVRR